MSSLPASPAMEWNSALPDYGDLFPTPGPLSSSANDQLLMLGPSLVKSFSYFSLFRTAKTPATPAPNIASLSPLFSLPSDPPPTAQQAVRALSAFHAYLMQLRSRLSTGDITANGTGILLAAALKGYAHAVFQAARVGWEHGDAEDAERLRQSVSISLQGLLSLYRALSTNVHEAQIDEAQMDDTRKILLASIFPTSPDLPYSHIVPVFDCARTLLTSLQATLRPTAHSKAVSRTSPAPVTPVSDVDAKDIMMILDVYANEVGLVEELAGPNKAKTKAHREQDKRRPLRIAIEARILRCDIAMSMANRDIKAIKARARSILSVQEDDDDKLDVADAAGAAVKWEQIAEESLVEVLKSSKAVLEARRGGVLSDRVERADWVGDEEPTFAPQSPTKSVQAVKVSDEASSEVGSNDQDDEDNEDEDDEVDTYPCPLRSIFRLHDRYEEQRLAIWLSLPSATRPGMGTYMRGEGDLVGEVWDELGLLLQLDYDSEALGNFGLSVDKLDKWVELAARRNAKKIRRKGRKTA